MSLVRYNPNWDPFRDMEEMMNRLPSVWQSPSLAQNAFIPAVDMYETKENVVVETALAGINPKDVQVSVENGMLVISGENKREREVEEKNYYRKETRSGSFYRQVPLPVAVNEHAVSAEFDAGILKITCPKTQPGNAKKIDVTIKEGKK